MFTCSIINLGVLFDGALGQRIRIREVLAEQREQYQDAERSGESQRNAKKHHIFDEML